MTPSEAELSKKLLNTQDKLITLYSEVSELRRRVSGLEHRFADSCRLSLSPHVAVIDCSCLAKGGS